MDNQLWIYVIIGVIYLLTRLFKKPVEGAGEAQETQEPEMRRTRTQPPPTEVPRQLTFEELLREITEGKQARPPQREPEPVYEQLEPYEKELGDEARSLERVDFDEVEAATRWKPYEEIPVVTERKSLEETMLLEDKKIEFGKFESFERKDQSRLLHNYIMLMRNPESLKQAIVMSEILKRKF